VRSSTINPEMRGKPCQSVSQKFSTHTYVLLYEIQSSVKQL
jgi:hypothetical protein